MGPEMTDNKVAFDGHALVQRQGRGIELFNDFGHADMMEIFKEGKAYKIKIEAVECQLEDLIGL